MILLIILLDVHIVISVMQWNIVIIAMIVVVVEIVIIVKIAMNVKINHSKKICIEINNILIKKVAKKPLV